jgi:signal peptidase II
MLERAIRPWWSWLALSVLVVVLDLATKAWVSATFRYGEVREVLPFFNLVLVHNTGAAFSFLAGEDGWQRWFFTILTIGICAAILVVLRRSADNRLLATALALVLGGALGNLYDRLTLGHVVDFVQLHAFGYYFPSFNVADSAITAGVVLLIWDGMRGQGAHGNRQESLAPLPEEKQ